MGAVHHLVEDFPLPVEQEVGQRRETQTLPFVERLPQIIVYVPLLAQMRLGRCRDRRSFHYGIVERRILIATGPHAKPALPAFQFRIAMAVIPVQQPIVTVQRRLKGLESKVPGRGVLIGLLLGDFRAFGEISRNLLLRHALA